MRFFLAIVAAAALTGCGAMQPTDSDLTARDWAKPGLKRAPAQEAVWCYRTIGRPDCVNEPIPGQEYRLIEGGSQAPEAKPMPENKNASIDSARLALFGE